MGNEQNAYDLVIADLEKEREKLAGIITAIPDLIYENHRNGRGGIRGKYVYVQEHKGQLKVAFTLHDPRLNCVIVTSSFWTTKNWLKRCVKEPPVYTKKKATP